MALKYEKKKLRQSVVLYSVITAIFLCATMISMMVHLYRQTEAEEYENLHVQTKQIKDDLVLQLLSDRENLTTMANFASKLYRDGESYGIMFESFKPIGMIENIGILNKDNTLTTKAGTSYVGDSLSFEEEVKKGVHISGRIYDITKTDYELIRSAVPIIVDGETIGILYGVIKPEKLKARYDAIVKELNAQLFVYEKSSGDILIDTIHNQLGNISMLKDRKYKEGYYFDQLVSTDKGFTVFLSAYKNEYLHLHYSTIEELDWMIAMGRYDAQVFASTHDMAIVMLIIFLIMMAVIVAYIAVLMSNERKFSEISECASEVRKELLETKGNQDNIQEALAVVCNFADARAALFFDTGEENYHYVAPKYKDVVLKDEERSYMRNCLVRYASELHKLNGRAINVLCIRPNTYMKKTNPSLFKFMREHNLREVSYSATTDKSNHITILAAINPANGARVRILAEKISACFSMALYNKNHLEKTIISATTDSLTGVFNRVAQKSDIQVIDEEQPSNFGCVYIDVNELHLCNNRYGHAAGDEMLLYVANSLRDAFYGQKVYRIGGDEFLVYCFNTTQEKISKNIENFNSLLKPRNYHVAVGMSFRSKNISTEEMQREAEKRMYEAKAMYYQEKEQQRIAAEADEGFVQVKTGIREIDTMLSVMTENYNGIYRVSLDSDKASRILMPAYLKYNENEEQFSSLFARYVDESVEPDYHRTVLSFMNYEAIKQLLLKNEIPRISYSKNNGETVVLSVYKLSEEENSVSDTLWVFAKQ